MCLTEHANLLATAFASASVLANLSDSEALKASAMLYAELHLEDAGILRSFVEPLVLFSYATKA